jgi:uncharacterized repeat protein (TIGR03803 family)
MRFHRACLLVFAAAFSAAPAFASSTVYEFKGGSDGAAPIAGLVCSTNAACPAGATLYGTTTHGGGSAVCYNNEGCGTVYSLSPTGVESVLYSFQGGSDGANPAGLYVDTGGNLWGTTGSGGGSGCGGSGCGTVFKLSPPASEGAPWTESFLYSFGTVTQDGTNPSGNLIEVTVKANGVKSDELIGTTQTGGGSGCNGFGCGTVFLVPLSATPGTLDTVYYSFQGYANGDGANPVGGLVAIGNKMYGMTGEGGTSSACVNCGTVFWVSLVQAKIAEGVIHSFLGSSANDGSSPSRGLVETGGALYGTTYNGGGAGCGTAFGMTTIGTESFVYGFEGGNDGCFPDGALVNMGATLYGTTQQAGANGGGTVFSLSTADVEAPISPDPLAKKTEPYAGLVAVHGVLYGTTYEGGQKGCNGHGCGTVFKVKP